MQLGVCGKPAIASLLAGAGFDFLEINVVRDLRPQEPESAVADRPAALPTTSLPILAANVFIPAELRLTGDAVETSAIETYVKTAFARPRQTGISRIVFGSGGARRIPDGYDRTRAWAQLVDFGRMIGPLALDHDITVVIEPLSYAECNVLNTVTESAQYVREVDHPAVRLLVDAYHWARNQEPTRSIVDAGPLLAHAHIATYANRLAPGREVCDFAPFFAALVQAGYRGGLSVEARWEVDPDSARTVHKTLLGLLEEARSRQGQDPYIDSSGDTQ